MSNSELDDTEQSAFLAELAGPLVHESNNFLNNLFLHMALFQEHLPDQRRADCDNVRKEGKQLVQDCCANGKAAAGFVTTRWGTSSSIKPSPRLSADCPRRMPNASPCRCSLSRCGCMRPRESQRFAIFGCKMRRR